MQKAYSFRKDTAGFAALWLSVVAFTLGGCTTIDTRTPDGGVLQPFDEYFLLEHDGRTVGFLHQKLEGAFDDLKPELGYYFYRYAAMRVAEVSQEPSPMELSPILAARARSADDEEDDVDRATIWRFRLNMALTHDLRLLEFREDAVHLDDSMTGYMREGALIVIVEDERLQINLGEGPPTALWLDAMMRRNTLQKGEPTRVKRFFPGLLAMGESIVTYTEDFTLNDGNAPVQVKEYIVFNRGVQDRAYVDKEGKIVAFSWMGGTLTAVRTRLSDVQEEWQE